MKKIEVLGSGCTKCIRLEELSRKAADELGLEYELSKVEDINKFADYGVIMTPALVVDGDVKVVGKVPSIEEIKKYIK